MKARTHDYFYSCLVECDKSARRYHCTVFRKKHTKYNKYKILTYTLSTRHTIFYTLYTVHFYITMVSHLQLNESFLLKKIKSNEIK